MTPRTLEGTANGGLTERYSRGNARAKRATVPVMEDREPDPDDWFDEPDVSDAWEARSERIARSRGTPRTPEGEDDDWLIPAEPEPRRPRSAPDRRLVALVGAALLGIALLFGLLAAAGVFSGGSKPATLPAPTTPTVNTQTVTTQPTTTAPPQPALPTATLKPGDQGAAVRLLQRALVRLGYSPGTIDGAYGPSTESAVKQFQQAHGLTADGIAGMKTLAAMRSALQ